MKTFFKAILIYALFATLIAILLGIYQLFQFSILLGTFFLGLYAGSITGICVLAMKFLDNLKEKINPIIKKLEKLKKWFKWLK